MNDKGYTVIELVISATIFGIMLVALTGALIQQQRQFNLTSEGIDMAQIGRSALDFLSSELRNSSARQSKSIGINFINGGSPNCFTDPTVIDTTGHSGQGSPPDCLSIFTWDITRGQDGSDLPSIASNVEMVSQSPLTIQLPIDWFTPDPDLVTSSGNDLIGFWARTSACLPGGSTSACLTSPHLCTDCGTILKIDNINALNQATFFQTNLDNLVAQNFQLGDYTTVASFTADFLNNIMAQNPEMTIVTSKSFRIDTVKKELEMEIDKSGTFTAIAGGDDNPGIVDMQFVFNLFNPDTSFAALGETVKVGVPLDETNNEYPHFGDFTSGGGGDLTGREKNIRSIEIYLVIRSRLKPQLISGNRLPVQALSEVGDVTERDTDHTSLGEGFIYKVFTTTVYARNFGREDFG